MEKLRLRLGVDERIQTVKEALMNVQWRDKCRSRSAHCKGCCTNLVKAVLVIFNLTFLILGWFLLGFGVWLHVYQESFYFSPLLQDHPHPPAHPPGKSSGVASALRGPAPLSTSSQGGGTIRAGQNAPSNDLIGTEEILALFPDHKPLYSYSNLPFVLIAVGAFLSGMSFLGCCGACAESVCFLVFYTLTTIFIIVIEILVGSVFSTVTNQMSARLLVNLQHQIQIDYNTTAQRLNMSRILSPQDKITIAWNELQLEMNCCGAVGPQDYMFSTWFNHTKDFSGTFVPQTCCSMTEDDFDNLGLESDNICQVEALLIQEKTKQPITKLRTRGCHQSIYNWFRSYEQRFLSLLSLIILLQMLNLLFACALIRWVRKKHTDYSWCENDEFE